ncbi:MAG: hypothetical protein VB095_00605 [Anaerovorax sp.]|nr:hypothetical protein [Anaerovorax sp.]
MKKQTLFYIGWDTIFLFMIFLSVFYEKYCKKSFLRYQYPIILQFWIISVFFVIVGIWISVLMFKGNKFNVNKKTAVLEGILVGIPAFCLATCMVLPFSLMEISWNSFPFPPFYSYLISTKVPMQLGGILFGYEIFIFIARMIDIRRTKKEKEPNKITKEV